MPGARSKRFTLLPHPRGPTQSATEVFGHVISQPDGHIGVAYMIKADTARLIVPPHREPKFADDLWRHTCCELFVARSGDPGYLEFNFSPSGEWAVYRFARTRERIPLDTDLAAFNPQITFAHSAEALQLSATIDLGKVSSRYLDAPLVVGISAVIEDDTGALSYWALRHPLEKPDFHHPQAFALELDEVRH